MPKSQQPSKKLKPFFWTKLSASVVSSTIWNEVNADVDLDLKDLEFTFSMESVPSGSSQMSGKQSKKQGPTTLLDGTRAQNVGRSQRMQYRNMVLMIKMLGIMLARIKLDPPVIRTAILELDDDNLSMDELKAIGKQLPTTEEV
jgi:diaphanous 1